MPIAPDLGLTGVPTELAAIRDRLDTVLSGLNDSGCGRVAFDPEDPDEPDAHFVLTTALREWAGDLRRRIQGPRQSRTGPNSCDAPRPRTGSTTASTRR